MEPPVKSQPRNLADSTADRNGCSSNAVGNESGGLSMGLNTVDPFTEGCGAPYAPNDWPNVGDKWRWSVGKKVKATGYYQDRYLYPPENYPRPNDGRRYLAVKSHVKKYIESVFPEKDANVFLRLFSWDIPASNFPKCREETVHSISRMHSKGKKLVKDEKKKTAARPPYRKKSDVAVADKAVIHKAGRRGKRKTKKDLPLADADRRKSSRLSTGNFSKKKLKETTFVDLSEESNSETTYSSSDDEYVHEEPLQTFLPEVDIPKFATIKSMSIETEDRSAHSSDNMMTGNLRKVENVADESVGIRFGRTSKERIVKDDVFLGDAKVAERENMSVDFVVAKKKLVEAKEKLNLLLAMKLSNLIASDKLAELREVISVIKMYYCDPSIDDLLKLHRIEEILLLGRSLGEVTEKIEKDRSCISVVSNIAKIVPVINCYNESNERATEIDGEINGVLKERQKLNNEICRLKTLRVEVVHRLDSKVKARNEIIAAQIGREESISKIMKMINDGSSKAYRLEAKQRKIAERIDDIIKEYKCESSSIK